MEPTLEEQRAAVAAQIRDLEQELADARWRQRQIEREIVERDQKRK